MPVKSMPTDFKSSMSLTVNTIYPEDVAMKNSKSIYVGILMLLSMLAVNGIALAKDPLEMSDKESCEQEAKESGLEGNELQEFVAQCLKDIREQNMTESNPSSGEK